MKLSNVWSKRSSPFLQANAEIFQTQNVLVKPHKEWKDLDHQPQLMKIAIWKQVFHIKGLAPTVVS